MNWSTWQNKTKIIEQKRKQKEKFKKSNEIEEFAGARGSTHVTTTREWSGCASSGNFGESAGVVHTTEQTTQRGCDGRAGGDDSLWSLRQTDDQQRCSDTRSTIPARSLSGCSSDMLGLENLVFFPPPTLKTLFLQKPNKTKLMAVRSHTMASSTAFGWFEPNTISLDSLAKFTRGAQFALPPRTLV